MSGYRWCCDEDQGHWCGIKAREIHSVHRCSCGHQWSSSVSQSALFDRKEAEQALLQLSELKGGSKNVLLFEILNVIYGPAPVSKEEG